MCTAAQRPKQPKGACAGPGCHPEGDLMFVPWVLEAQRLASPWPPPGPQRGRGACACASVRPHLFSLLPAVVCLGFPLPLLSSCDGPETVPRAASLYFSWPLGTRMVHGRGEGAVRARLGSRLPLPMPETGSPLGWG